MRFRHFILLLLSFLWLDGCSPNPPPDPLPNDSTSVVDTVKIDTGWEILDQNEDGYACLYSKENGDSITIVAVDGCSVIPDEPYTIISDFRMEKRRIITIGLAMSTIADSSMRFDFSLVPDQIDYDKLNPNSIGVER